MRALRVLSASVSRVEGAQALSRLPIFRKASHNMLLTASAVETVLRETPDLAANDTAVVLGSSLGELELTKDFLGNLATTGAARPLLFQGSLHNATLGFLAMHYGFKGPSFTVSRRYFTGENCLETAQILLGTGVCRRCLVLCVEGSVPTLQTSLQSAYPAEFRLGEGASALLLDAAGEGPTGKIVIESVEMYPPQKSPAGEPLIHEGYFDSDAVTRLIESFGTGQNERTIRLRKPDQSESEIRWTRR